MEAAWRREEYSRPCSRTASRRTALWSCRTRCDLTPASTEYLRSIPAGSEGGLDGLGEFAGRSRAPLEIGIQGLVEHRVERGRKPVVDLAWPFESLLLLLG